MSYNIIIYLISLIGLVYMCSNAVIYFAVAFVFAYLLNPAVKKLTSWKIPKGVSSLVMIFSVLSVFIGGLALLFPILYHQTSALLHKVVAYQGQLHKNMVPRILNWVGSISPELIKKVESGIINITHEALGIISNLIYKIVHSGGLALNTLASIIFIPIIAFYILRDWDNIIKTSFDLIPNRFRKAVTSLTQEIDKKMSGYLRGQTYACLIMAVYYMVALSIIGLDSSIVLGFFSGLAIIIPYAGIASASIFCVIVGLLQNPGIYHILNIIVVFLIGHLLESNIISPKIIGDSIGIHPAWLLFGIIVGGSLLGFIGILISVPLTAVISAVIKFSVMHYKNSKFYKIKG